MLRPSLAAVRAALPALALSLLVSGVAPADERGAFRPALLPPDEERAAALSAGPKAIAAGAGIWLLGEGGFTLDRPSTNGFHCLVQRSHATAFEPQCFDEEGAKTLMQATLLEAELRMGGRSQAEIDAGVAAAWASGRLRAPSRPGINYMLSGQNRVPADETGSRIVPYRPHVMFYVPYLTNRDLGGDPNGDSPLFVISEGTPHAYAIVPVPAETVAAHQDAHP